jgi:hypothetical protein
MSEKQKEILSDALRDADLVELDEERLEEVAGGVCDESCLEGCSACCSIGSANRGKPAV